MSGVEKALEEIEAEIEDQIKANQDEAARITEEYVRRRDKLTTRRYDLVNGKAAPSSEELAGEPNPGAGVAAKVPLYWLSVLLGHDGVADAVTDRDRAALENLVDVKALPGRVLELHFAGSKHFSNRVLRRGEGVTTDIDWHEGKNLTVREVGAAGVRGKKGGKGGKGGKKGGGGGDDEADAAAPRRRVKGCPSFFRLFKAPAAASSGKKGRAAAAMYDPTALGGGDEHSDDDEATAAAAGSDEDAFADLLSALLDDVIPKATELFLAGQLASAGAGDGNNSDDDDDGSFELVGGGGGNVDDLPPNVRAVVAALRSNQAALNAAASARRAALAERRSALLASLDALYARRRAALLAPAADGTDGASPAQQLLLSRFWLSALRCLDAAALAITPRDATVLADLLDVRLRIERPGGPDSDELHATLELEFLPSSQYLAPGSTTLVKTYTLAQQPAAAASAAQQDGALPLRIVSSRPKPAVWLDPSRDPTTRRAPDGKQRPSASLFHLFRPGGGKLAFGLVGGDERSVQAEANELEAELLLELSARLLPSAGALYAEAKERGLLDDGGDDEVAWAALAESDEDEDDSDGSEGGGGGGSGAAARRAARRSAHARLAAGGAGWRPSKGAVLAFLMLFIVLAQLLGTLEMIAAWTKRA